MMRLHPLHRHDEQRGAIGFDLLSRANDGAFSFRPRPEQVPNVTPRCLRVGTVVRTTVLSNLISRSDAGNLDIYEGIGVDNRLDGVRLVVLGEGDRDVIRIEGTLLLIEFVVRERPRGP